MTLEVSGQKESAAPWQEETTGLCPSCLRTVPVLLCEEAGGIWLIGTCPRHGESRALIATDPREYLRLRQYVPDRAKGCCCGPGEDCGPANGGPPTCVLLLEITQSCNLRCPTCYADARRHAEQDITHDFMTLDEAKRRLDTFFQAQGGLDVLMLSGGEPTIHPQFAEFLDLALTYPIGRILVNTNGLRIAQNDAVRDAIAARRDRIELYLSFASFREATHVHLYGRDLREEKRKALERASEAGIFVTLVPTVENGINDDEIGELYRFALSLPTVNGITYQPVMDTGRYRNSYDPAERLTLTGVLRILEEQTGGDLRTADFVGLPCSHPDCCALTYGLLDTGRTTLTPLPRHLDVARYLDLFADRISFSGIIGGAARRVWSDMTHLRGGQTLRDLGILFARGGVRDVLPLLGKPEEMGKRVFRVVVKPFMDAHTYDHNRVQECCTKIVNERGEAVSFCEYNVFHRGRAPKAGARPLMMAK